ncbi:MAG: glycosyltransferase family 39 protein [Bdellovibrionota bacterium]
MAFLLCSSLLIFVLRLWLSLYAGVHPDEAYYWVWAQNLHLGYYDHPPMVAYLIRISQSIFEFIFGNNFEGSKSSLFLSFRWLPGLLGYVGLPILIGSSIQQIQRKSLSMSQVFALLSTPLVIFGAQIITPDLPLTLVWAASFLLALRMNRKLRHKLRPGMATPFSWYFSIWMGILWALGAYSKYTAIFLPLLFIISGAGFWNTLVAGLICICATTPYFYWTFTEAMQNRMGIFYQLDRGTNILGTEAKLKYVGDMWAAQLLFWSPAFVLDYLYTLGRKRSFSWSMAAWIFLPLFFFSITGLRNRPEANWPVMGGIALAVLVLSRHSKHPLRLFWFTGINYACLILALWAMLNQATLGKLIAPFNQSLGEKLQSKVSRIEEFRGWDNLRNLVFESTLTDEEPILVEKYHVISPLIFFDRIAKKEEKLGDRLKIDLIPGKSVSQYHFEKNYIPGNPKSFWFLRKGEAYPDAKNCERRQTFIKADPIGEVFSLFKCRT